MRRNLILTGVLLCAFVRPFAAAVADDVASDPARYTVLHAKWQAVLRGMDGDAARLADCRADAEACSMAEKRLHELVEAGRAHAGRARLGHINRAINLGIRALPDARQSGAADRWSSPLHTLQAGAGDCEDYAILKLMVLRELGVAEHDLRLIVVADVRRDAAHAVAAVRLGEDWIVLDNRGFALARLSETRYRVLLQLAPAGPAVVAAAAATEPDATM